MTKIRIGIQGGKGSFNEEAVFDWLSQQLEMSVQIRYLYTTEQVLVNLRDGKIDRGQFALYNSIGGLVSESIEAMKKYQFRSIASYSIPISHTLMMRSDANRNELTTIMTHPQTLIQCKTMLKEKYPQLIQKSGTGDSIDHAYVAQMLSEKILEKNIATIGSIRLSSLYGLTIVEKDMQDDKKNFTSFLQVMNL